MQTKQTITIIGDTLNIGSFLAKSLSKGNYRLLLCTGTSEKVEILLQEIKSINPQVDAETAACPFDASWESDIIIVAEPFEAQEAIAERIKSVANQKVVISLTTTETGAAHELALARYTPEAEMLKKLLPNSKIVRVVISSFEGKITSNSNTTKQIDASISGDDKAAVETVTALFRSAGLNPILDRGFSLSENV